MPTLQQTLKRYQRDYELLYPTRDSFGIANRLWAEWEADGHTRPDVRDIHGRAVQMERDFFFELADFVRGRTGSSFEVEYLAFCLDSYNCCAFSASDGYLVLVDEVYFQMLFMTTMLITHDCFENIAPAEQPSFAEEFTGVLQGSYLDRGRYRFADARALHEVMARSFDHTEFANYLFQSFKAFALLHELGHHVLGHTHGTTTMRHMASAGQAEDFEIDRRRWEEEYEADAFAYDHYRELIRLNDNSKATFFAYSLDFAPLLFLEMIHRLESFKSAHSGTRLESETHPAPRMRFERLRAAKKISATEPAMLDLLESLSRYLPG